LLEGGEIRSNLAVAIDGGVARMGMLEPCSDSSEVHFAPVIGGGQAPAMSIDWPDCGRLQYPQGSIL
jgi:hypothetical protein